jgi:hypothetical protein
VEGLAQFIISVDELSTPSLFEVEEPVETDGFLGPDMVHLPLISLVSSLAAFTPLQFSRAIN